jgi:hypothetical protein
MSLNSISNLINWWERTSFRSPLILTCCRFFSETKLILVNFFFSVIVHPTMRRFWILIQTGILSISISPTSSWKNIFGKCCWKVFGGIAILTDHTNTNLIGIIDETSGSKIGSIGLLTCLTKLKPIDVINLTSWFDQTCHNPTFGLTTNAKVGEGVGQEWTCESHFMFPRVQESVREWTLALPSELSLWELESQWTLESSESNFRGQNSLGWRFLNIIRKLLECRCLKWAFMTHLDTSNISYGQKKGQESNCQKSNCQFDSQPLKVSNHLDFLACRWLTTYRWKALNKGYNFALHFISIEVLQIKLWARIPTLGISGLSFRSLGGKWHLGADLVAMHIVYHKGEGGGFPKSRPWWVSWVRGCVARSCTKVPQLCTNQPVVWFVQVRVNKWIVC